MYLFDRLLLLLLLVAVQLRLELENFTLFGGRKVLGIGHFVFGSLVRKCVDVV